MMPSRNTWAKSRKTAVGTVRPDSGIKLADRATEAKPAINASKVCCDGFHAKYRRVVGLVSTSIAPHPLPHAPPPGEPARIRLLAPVAPSHIGTAPSGALKPKRAPVALKGSGRFAREGPNS